MKKYERDMETGFRKGKEEVLLNMCRNPRFTDSDIASAGGISLSEVSEFRQRLIKEKK